MQIWGSYKPHKLIILAEIGPFLLQICKNCTRSSLKSALFCMGQVWILLRIMSSFQPQPRILVEIFISSGEFDFFRNICLAAQIFTQIIWTHVPSERAYFVVWFYVLHLREVLCLCGVMNTTIRVYYFPRSLYTHIFSSFVWSCVVWAVFYYGTWLNFFTSVYSVYLSSPVGHTDADLECKGESLLSGPIWLSCRIITGSEESKNNQQPLGIATYTLEIFCPSRETHTLAMETRTVAKTRFITQKS